MITITDAGLRWAADGRVWVVAGDPALASGEFGQPICGLSDAMAAAWLAATDGVPVAAVHEALLGLDRYEQFYRQP
jgi:hypothetical protein